MPKAIPIISAFHNLNAGDLADEHGQLCAQIPDLATRKRALAGELIRRGVTAEGALFRSIVVAETMVATLDRAGIEKAMARRGLPGSSNGRSARPSSRRRPAPAPSNWRRGGR